MCDGVDIHRWGRCRDRCRRCCCQISLRDDHRGSLLLLCLERGSYRVLDFLELGLVEGGHLDSR